MRALSALVLGLALILPGLVKACYINNELKKMISKIEPAPQNIAIAGTDKIDDAKKIIGIYVTFKGAAGDYVGYLRFNQQTCQGLFSDIQKIYPVDLN